MGGVLINLQKLKPWNWFKHEDDEDSHIPVTKNEATEGLQQRTGSSKTAPPYAMNSLLQLHQEMDRLFDAVWSSFGLSKKGGSRNASLFENDAFDPPALGDFRAYLDVSGDENEYEVSIDLPGLSEDDITIELANNVLTVSGQKEEARESKDKHYYRVERSVGTFQRKLSLPEDASAEEIAPTMQNGVLTSRIPRRALAKEDVKHIPVSSLTRTEAVWLPPFFQRKCTSETQPPRRFR